MNLYTNELASNDYTLNYSTEIMVYCFNCNKELREGYIKLLHTDGLFRSYCNECAAQKLNIVY